MHRHGFAARRPAERRGCREVYDVEGLALHLPLGNGHVDEVDRWLGRYDAGALLRQSCERRTSWPSCVADIRRSSSGRRIGTDLWLGDRVGARCRSPPCSTYTRSAVATGSATGSARIAKDGHVLVLSGGTAHGIALEAPAPAASTRQRAVSVAKGGLEATGRALSPFVVGGKQRWFVEPPHMQVSMVFVPADVDCPAPGDEVDVQVRYTTTTFDRVSQAELVRPTRLSVVLVVDCRIDARPERRRVDAFVEYAAERVVGQPVGSDRILPRLEDVADHQRDEVELAGDPDDDRERVDPVPLARHRRRSSRCASRSRRSRRSRRPARSSMSRQRGRASTASGSSQITYCGE